MRTCHGVAQGDSDLQLERVNVYFNEAGGGACSSTTLAESCGQVRAVTRGQVGVVTCGQDSASVPCTAVAEAASLCRAVCAARHPHGPGARHHGLCAVRPVWPDLQTRQLHFRPGARVSRSAAASTWPAIPERRNTREQAVSSRICVRCCRCHLLLQPTERGHAASADWRWQQLG